MCLDVTEQIVDEAIARGCNLVVSHHPLIFHKLAHITGENDVQRTVLKAIKNDVAIISMHTNLDSARDGVNFKIAEKLGLKEPRFFGDEQVAYTGNDASSGRFLSIEGGEGVIAHFAEPVAADDFILMLKQRFSVECVMANQLLRRPIRSVAICGGAGAFLLRKAISEGADAFVTGEMSYHDYFDHDQEIQIAVIGHYQSEQFTTEVLRDVIERDCPGVTCHISEINTNPIIYL